MVRALNWNLRLPICFIVCIESPWDRRAVKLTLEKVAGAVDIVFLDSILRIRILGRNLVFAIAINFTRLTLR